MLVAAFLFLLGLIWGSFLNVAVHRLPGAEGAGRNAFAALCWPMSFCPHCKTPLKPLQLIPLLSFAFLRGRSTCCGARISWRYPLVELAGAALVLLSAFRFGLGLDAVFAAAFLSAMLVASVVDLSRYIIPNATVLPVLWLGLIANVDARFALLPDAVWGAAAGYVSLYMLAHAAEFVFRRPALAPGDCKIFAAAGAWLGWEHLPFVLFGAAVCGLVLFVVRQVLRGKAIFGGRGYVPFGPCIAMSAAVMLFYGERIMLAYWQFIGG